jgi:Mg2+ and Co2+ transporter CorA
MGKGKRTSTPGDLGTEILSCLTATYKHAHRRLESWLQLWELELHKARLKNMETRTLHDLFALVNEFRRRLSAMNYARSVTDDNTWFPESDEVADKAADAMLDRTLKKLALLFENIRADMELVTMEHVVQQAVSAAQQAALVAKSTQIMQEQRIANEHFQDRLAKVTALLLVPTLIAGIYGANTRLPGGGRWAGFEAMVVLMVIASAAVYMFMLRRNRADAQRLDEHGSTDPSTGLSQTGTVQAVGYADP